jgi:hypothetical protein
MKREQIISIVGEKVAQHYADRGELVNLGWVAFWTLARGSQFPGIERAVHLAYMAGAEHLFQSILSILEPGSEATETDCARMEKIQSEIDRYRTELESAFPRGKQT